MKYCTWDNVQLYDADSIISKPDVHLTSVRPAVLRDEFVHPDDKEGFGGVVEQREASVCLPLVYFVCLYQAVVIPIVLNVAEGFLSALVAVFVLTYEVKYPTFHTGDFGFDTDQSCRSEQTVSCPVIGGFNEQLNSV